MTPPANPPPLRRAAARQPSDPGRRPQSLGLAPDPEGEVVSASGLGDPTDGEWLFKQGDVVLGPVGVDVLVARIESGELTVDTPIGREAGKWVSLSEVPYFAEVHERATEAKEREARQKAAQAKLRRVRSIRVVAVVILVVVPLAAGTLLGQTIMVKRPWDDSAEWVQRAPPLVDLPPKPKASPQKQRAAAGDVVARAEEPRRSDDEDLVEAEDGSRADPDDKDDGRARKGRRGKDSRLAKGDKRDRKGDKTTKGEDKLGSEDKAADKTTSGQNDKTISGQKDERLPQTLTAEQVQQGLLKGKAGIGSCLKAEVSRNPDMPSVVTLTFTVTEQGKAVDVRLKEREVRDGPLAACLVGVVTKLSWPRFTGERQNAEFPFKIKR